jgi:hypothetical protein
VSEVFELGMDELRAVTAYAADCANMVLDLFERHHPTDRRPRDAVTAARTFAGGGRRDKGLRDVSWAALRAAQGAHNSAAGHARGTHECCPSPVRCRADIPAGLCEDGATSGGGEKMPGKIDRPISEILAVAFMVVGASVGVFLAVEQNFVLRIIIIALGAIAGLGIGRQIGLVIERRQTTKRPPR